MKKGWAASLLRSLILKKLSCPCLAFLDSDRLLGLDCYFGKDYHGAMCLLEKWALFAQALDINKS